LSDLKQKKGRLSAQQTALSQPGWHRSSSDFGAMRIRVILDLDCSINLREKKACRREGWSNDFQPYNR